MEEYEELEAQMQTFYSDPNGASGSESGRPGHKHDTILVDQDF